MSGVGARYAGYDLDELRDWIERKSQDSDYSAGYNTVDLGSFYDGRSRLPDPFQDAWLPEDPDIAVWPDGAYCRAQLDPDSGDVRVTYRAQLLTAAGGQGALSRSFDTATGKVSHTRFDLPSDEWSSGHGKRAMKRSAELYDRLGLDSIHITAANLGRYIWPMCGFESEGEGEHAKIVQAIRTFAGALGYSDLGDENFEYLWEYSALRERSDGSRVTVSREAVLAALDKLGRSPDALEIEIRDEMAIDNALLVWNAQLLWPGVFYLDSTKDGASQLASYTQDV